MPPNVATNSGGSGAVGNKPPLVLAKPELDGNNGYRFKGHGRQRASFHGLFQISYHYYGKQKLKLLREHARMWDLETMVTLGTGYGALGKAALYLWKELFFLCLLKWNNLARQLAWFVPQKEPELFMKEMSFVWAALVWGYDVMSSLFHFIWIHGLAKK